MSQFKRKLSAFTAMLALVSFSGAALAVSEADVIGKTSNAQVIDLNSKRTDINVVGGKGAIAQVDFKNFNVAADEHVNYGFSDLSQTMINRVLGGQESKILGKITNSCINGGSCSSYAATSKVVLINPAGVMFGAGSTVDLNSFTASTFDINGAKNLQNMTNAQIEAYQNNVLNKMSPTTNVNGTSNEYGNITFDSNYTTAFNDAGIDMSQLQGKTKITLNGTHFDKFNYNDNYDITGVADLNTNKSVNIVSDNVDYKDSLIRTGSNYNYADYDQSFGNVRIVTADGVTFKYLSNGYADKYQVNDDTKTDVVRNVSIDNSNLAANKTGIEAGDVRIINKSNADNSNIKVKNTLIKANKMVNGENGNVLITGSKDVEITSTRIDTVNTSVTKNGVTKDTTDKAGGEVYISADNNLNVTDSLITTAGSKNTSAETAGAVRLYSQGSDVNIKNTKVLSDGKLDAIAYNNVNTENSLLQASNTVDKTQKKNVTISGTDGVNIKNTTVDATGNVDITSKYANDKVAGNINISSTKNASGENQTLIFAGDDLSIEGANTTLDNASLTYDNIKFYNNKTTGTNNVTVKNDSTFTQANSSDITLETNGNFTMDKATMRTASMGLNINGDDGTVNGITYTTSVSPATASNINVKSTEGNVSVVNNSDIVANKDINMTATNGNYTQDQSKLTAGKDININSGKNTSINKSTSTANNDLNVTAGGKIDVNQSNLNATVNNATLIANGTGNDGNISITNDSKIEAGNDVTVKSTKGNEVKVDDSKVIAGSDSEGFDVVKDANDTKGDATIEATNGSVNIKNNSTVTSQDKDVNIIAKNTIKFGNDSDNGTNIGKTSDITAAKNITVKSTSGNIEGEKTTMPELTYGDRLTFDAKGDNIFTSADSLKSVNVDYKAGGANRFYTTDDIQFVNSSLEAPNNFVESGDDVILNNLTVKQATPDAKDTVTKIYANGNVTTDNVTNEDLTAKGGVFPKSVSADRTGTDKTTMDISKTKLIVQTDTVKDPANPDDGTISLDLKNADNPNAGVDLTAQNVKALDKDPTGGYNKPGYYKSGDPQWDGDVEPLEHAIAEKQGPEVRLNATDNNISIANIDTDKLTLDPNDNKIADTTNGTPKITIKDQGGFNLDPDLDYNPDKTGDGFTYDKNYNEKDVTVEGGDLTFDDWSEWKLIETRKDPDGTVHEIYESTRDGRITDKITTKTDQEHKITFDNNGNPTEFTLVYDKKETTVEPGREITAEAVKDDPSIVPPGTTPDDFIKIDDRTCPPPPPVDFDADSLIDAIKLPKEQVEISKTSTVADGTADQTSAVMSAAAKVDIVEEDTGYQTPDDDDELLDME